MTWTSPKVGVLKMVARKRAQGPKYGHKLGAWHASHEGLCDFVESTCSQCGAKVVLNLYYREIILFPAERCRQIKYKGGE